jgi:hypothetical protein
MVWPPLVEETDEKPPTPAFDKHPLESGNSGALRSPRPATHSMPHFLVEFSNGARAWVRILAA